MHSPWVLAMQELAAIAIAEVRSAAGQFLTFGHVFQCIDPRCVPVYKSPYKIYPFLGGHVDNRNGVAVTERLEHDARRAARQGKHQLVIVEAHTECRYGKTYGVSPERIWADAERWLGRIPNTTIVRCLRDTAWGALTFFGPRHPIEVARLNPSGVARVTDLYLRQLVSLAGFADPHVAHDMVHLIQGNLEHLRRTRDPLPPPLGVAIGGTCLPRASTHFAVSNRFEPDLKRAIGIACSKICEHGAQPEVAVVIAQNPQRPDKQGDYQAALRFLKGSVHTALSSLNGFGQLPVHTLLVQKGTGLVQPVTV